MHACEPTRSTGWSQITKRLVMPHVEQITCEHVKRGVFRARDTHASHWSRMCSLSRKTNLTASYFTLAVGAAPRSRSPRPPRNQMLPMARASSIVHKLAGNATFLAIRGLRLEIAAQLQRSRETSTTHHNRGQSLQIVTANAQSLIASGCGPCRSSPFCETRTRSGCSRHRFV